MTYTSVTTYLRVSHPDQARKGTGLEGQRRDCEAFALSLGVVIDQELVEGGKSGFHAKHRAEGAVFYAYEQDVLAGVHHGSLLILSNLDRLTRENSDDAGDLMRSLSRHGVTIATADDKEVYQAGVPKRLDQGIRALLKMELAHEEQVKKSGRLKRAYDVRHDHCRANKLAVTKQVAPWIIVSEDRTMTLDAAKVDLLNRVFRMADEGRGAKRIADMLNLERVPLWHAREKKQATCWGRTRITKMLKDRSAIGEFQPTRGGKPNGPVWTDHFPRAVDADLFERVQRDAKTRKDASTGNRDEKISNLFTGLIRCGCCGDRVTYQAGRKAGTKIVSHTGNEYTYRRDNGSLVCYRANARAACTNRKYLAYLTFENAVLTACLHLALDDTAFSRKDEVGRLNVTIAEQERALSLLTETATNLAMAWAAKPSDMRRQMADQAEDEAERLAVKVAALKAQREDARGRVGSQEHLARVEGIRANLYHEDLEVRVPIRRKVQHALRNVIHSMTLEADGSVTVVMDGGLVAFEVHKKHVRPINDTLEAIRSGVIPLPRGGNRLVQAKIVERMKKAVA